MCVFIFGKNNNCKPLFIINIKIMRTISSKLYLCFLVCVGVLMSCSRDTDNDIVPLYDLQIDGQDYFLLAIGETATVNFKIVPIHTTDKTLTWSSDDETIATVEDGVITGVSVGNTRIVGKSNSDPQKSIEVLVRVNAVSVTSIVLDVDPIIELELNDERTITATILPADAPQEIIWKSSDESVVTVSPDGEIKALEYGEAIVSATSVSDETKSGTVRVVVVGLVETILDNKKFAGLPHSSEFKFSPWGTSDLGALWNNNFASNALDEVFYIENKSVTYFGVDLGVKAKLTSMRYWGRTDNYFMLRHPKKIQVYGTDDPTVANNPESPDTDWILLSGDVPFESVRPFGGTGKPATGDPNWLYANEGERFSFGPTLPAVRYIRFKCLETWGSFEGGNVEGFWATEIAFWGEEVE